MKNETDLLYRFATLGLKQRHSQLEMMRAVYAAIENAKILCVEAPTGVGKTLAYGLASLLAKKPKQKIIISTATVALQTQILKKDIRLMEALLDRKISVSIAKGRRRYLCHARLLDPDNLLDRPDTALCEKLKIKLRKDHWSGDKDELDFPVPELEWQKLTTDRTGCAGARCPYIQNCAFFNAKKEMQSSEMVITNHHLLLADLELGGGVLLPPPEESIYIIDECHHFPEQALNHFSKQAALVKSLEWLNLISKQMNKAKVYLPLEASFLHDLQEAVTELVRILLAIRDEFAMKFSGEGPIFPLETLDPSLLRMAEDLPAFALRISAACEEVLARLEKLPVGDAEETFKTALTTLIGSLGFLEQRAHNLAQTWMLLLKEAQPPIAKWLEKKPLPTGEMDFTCFASPIYIGKDLQDLFWDRAKSGVILCSATIRALGEFQDFTRKLGLGKTTEITTLALSSPFQHEKSTLRIPPMLTTPKQAKAHLEETTKLLPTLLKKQAGILVLFTSREALETTYQGLPKNLQADILKQGDHPFHALITRHKEAVDAGRRSILFGLNLLSEGVDLPGRYCEQVIIHKLPFQVPTDPIAQTRERWLKANGLNSFALVSLPEASLRLTQFVGRLLRDEADVGEVMILDRRLVTEAYGKKLLANLPPFLILLE